MTSNLLPKGFRLYAPKPMTTQLTRRVHGKCVLYVEDGGIGKRYQLWCGWGDHRHMLLDRFILDSGKADDLTRPPYEWEHEL